MGGGGGEGFGLGVELGWFRILGFRADMAQGLICRGFRLTLAEVALKFRSPFSRCLGQCRPFLFVVRYCNFRSLPFLGLLGFFLRQLKV